MNRPTYQQKFALANYLLGGMSFKELQTKVLDTIMADIELNPDYAENELAEIDKTWEDFKESKTNP